LGIQRIALAFHSSGPAQKLFLDKQYLFSENDSTNENVTWLIDVINTFDVSNLDFLACNTLNFANWTNYFQQLTGATNVIIGASDDRTGNLKYGGDWIMESTKEDIESIYFTSSAIENYQHVFAFPVTVGDVVYSQNGANATVSNFTQISGNTSAIIQPQITDGGTTYNVTGIAANAFLNKNITSVTIPSSVTTIGNTAFNNCSGLTSVTIPNSVTTLGIQAFEGCILLTSVTIPSSVTTIGDRAFNRCSGLTSITIQNSIIGAYMFYDCSGLTSVTIPSSVTTVGTEAFRNCTGLTSITIQNSTMGNNMFRSCTSLTSVTIPSSVTNMGQNGFISCTGLTSILIQNSTIGQSMFNMCTGLTSVTIPSSVTSIGPNAFRFCTSLTSVTIQNSTMGGGMFEGCTALTSVTIPSSVTDPGNFAFQNCTGLTSVTIQNSRIAANMFQGCSFLTSITIPSSVTIMGNTIFLNCIRLSSVTIQNTFITQGMFTGCIALRSVTIPSTVTTIGSNAFSGISNLTVTFEANEALPTFAGRIVTGTPTTALYRSTVTGNPQQTLLSVGVGFTEARLYNNNPTITNFAVTSRTFGASPFNIIDPSSNSTGSFSFASDNTSVASISGRLITIISAGTATITATQAATSNFLSGVTSTQFEVTKADPTITNFAVTSRTFGASPFNIVDPSSNSTGSFSFASGNTSVASISGRLITIIGAGTATITATQAATSNFLSGVTSTQFEVSQSTVENPLVMEDGNALSYFLTSNASYAAISKNMIVDYDLTSSTPKTLVTDNDVITIRRGEQE
jgi:hypothetical protein